MIHELHEIHPYLKVQAGQLWLRWRSSRLELMRGDGLRQMHSTLWPHVAEGKRKLLQ